MNQERGFTLIELLVTMVIIGLITSFALPNFSKIQSRAKENNIKSTLHSLQVSIEAYAASNGTYPSGSNLGAASLTELLKSSGEFNKLPTNPFTGNPYTDQDSSGKITYSLDSQTNVYTLTGFSASNSTEILKLQNL